MNVQNSQRYQYQPLESLTHIRVLHIRPGDYNEPLRCDIIHKNLNELPNYEALSYVWGPPTFDHIVRIGTDACLQITKSLHSALRDLRQQKHTIIWADALCINQQDLDEKAIQLPMMYSIYQHAQQVLLYIGEADREATQAIKFAQELVDKITRPQGEMANWKRKEDLKAFGLPLPDHHIWNALKKLMKRPWSLRACIVQEYISNPNLIMFCGINEFRADLFSSIVGVIDAWDYDLPLGNNIGLDGQLTDLHAFNMMRVLQKSTHQSGFNLFGLLTWFHRLQCSDPRDKIYSLLGAANDREELRLSVSYKQDTADVYTDCATRILQKHQHPKLFECVLYPKAHDLPSWVPDWSVYPAPGYTKLRGLRTSPYKAALSHHPSLRVDKLLRKVYIDGLTVGEVAWKDDAKAHLNEHQIALFCQSIHSSSQRTTPCGYNTDILARCLTGAGFPRFEESTGSELLFDYCNSILTPGSTRPESGMDTIPFQREVERMICQRTMLRTRQNNVGMGPLQTKIGDIIVLFSYSTTAYVLRPYDAEFALIGEAYIDGIMYGEYFDEQERQLRTFTLI